jgi:DNA-binding XRE family transcriptional regulator
MAKPRIEISPEDIAQIEKMAGLGLTVEQMAALLEMSKATFDRRMEDTPGAIEALEKGRATASHKVMETAYRMATSGRTPAMTMFWLKCRERWREVSVHEHSGPGGRPIETRALNQLTDGEIDERLAALNARLLTSGADPGSE